MRKTLLTALASILLLSALSSCEKKDDSFAKSITRLMSNSLATGLEEGAPEILPLDEQEIKRMEKQISEKEELIGRLFREVGDTAYIYQALGWKYMQAGMYGMALQCFEKALEIYPSMPMMLTLCGISTSYLAQYEPDETQRASLAMKAKFYFEQSIFASPDNPQAFYGLANLELFIFNSPENAKKNLSTLLGLEPKNYNAWFLLANCEIRLENYDLALEAYDMIAKGSENKQLAQRAKDNADTIRGKAYE